MCIFRDLFTTGLFDLFLGERNKLYIKHILKLWIVQFRNCDTEISALFEDREYPNSMICHIEIVIGLGTHLQMIFFLIISHYLVKKAIDTQSH